LGVQHLNATGGHVQAQGCLEQSPRSILGHVAHDVDPGVGGQEEVDGLGVGGSEVAQMAVDAGEGFQGAFRGLEGGLVLRETMEAGEENGGGSVLGQRFLTLAQTAQALILVPGVEEAALWIGEALSDESRKLAGPLQVEGSPVTS
jgi:hypothetical protein